MITNYTHDHREREIICWWGGGREGVGQSSTAPDAYRYVYCSG